MAPGGGVQFTSSVHVKPPGCPGQTLRFTQKAKSNERCSTEFASKIEADVDHRFTIGVTVFHMSDV
ncbi:hypothetical protein Hypma_002310 [Hypsizygus marmoreus]|uniref:Uncharacterized protein n=1 Tax=Hypsizygus marmoreus TaxID=39966 RepID=A0A369K826_HYPMA|nr:hypothetical protein Hypma_002310 [Hypsizygus marmoreus]